MEHITLKARYFGSFALLDPEGKVLLEQRRGNKSYTLLQYLLLNRDSGLRRDELIDYLLSKAQQRDAANTLKIIIHRTRRLLVAAGLPENCIRYQRGRYFWDPSVACIADCDQFRLLLRQAEQETDAATAEDLLRQAIALVGAPFLCQMPANNWIRGWSASLRAGYCHALARLVALLGARGAYQEALDLCQQALQLYPAEESLHYLYIAGLSDLGRRQEAQQYCLDACRLVSGECEQLHEMRRRLAGADKAPGRQTKEQIIQALTEGDSPGAVYCSLPIFAENYRYLCSYGLRSGQPATLVLLTVTDQQGVELESETAMGAYSVVLLRSINNTLRHSDLYTRYSASRFLILLTNANSQDLDSVRNRLLSEFAEQAPYSHEQLRFEIITSE